MFGNGWSDIAYSGMTQLICCSWQFWISLSIGSDFPGVMGPFFPGQITLAKSGPAHMPFTIFPHRLEIAAGAVQITPGVGV